MDNVARGWLDLVVFCAKLISLVDIVLRGTPVSAPRRLRPDALAPYSAGVADTGAAPISILPGAVRLAVKTV